jgi:hypothetical protein
MLRRVALVASVAVVACQNDDAASTPSTEAGTSAGSGSTTGTSSSTSGIDTGASSGSTSPADSGSDGGPMQIEYARGLRLMRMTANQGVQVEIVADGVEVLPAEYNTRLVAGRRTLLRAFWSLHHEFEPRELVGQLTVDYPDGSQLTQDFEVMVDGDSNDGGASFQWLLEPDDIVEGMRFRARILEPDPSLTTLEVSEPPPVLPLSGPGTLGIYDVPLQMKVVLVPVLHQFEGCESMPEITEQDAEDMRKQLEQANPVQSVELSVREPMPYTETIGEAPGFTPILAELAATRAADMPDDNVYYYGLLQPCDGFPPGLLGQAIGIPNEPTKENAQQRVSTGRWLGSGLAASETFVHEVGHSQGRRHVVCSGGEGGPDLNYPHPNGRIGVWGFGIYDFKLRTPTGARDYMTYCSNEWVSDYGWEQVLEVIEILTSWDYEDAVPEPKPTMLYGILHEDGTEDWWTAPGGLPKSAAATVVYDFGGAPITLPAAIEPIPHGEARYVIAPLPDGGLLATTTATLHPTPDTAHTVPMAQVRTP